MPVTVITFCIAIVAIHYCFLHYHYAFVESQHFKFYAIRDQLRAYAARGEVDSRSWVFLYLDSSIVKSITMHPFLDIWRTALLLWAWKRSHRYKQARERHEALLKELHKPENEKLYHVYCEYLAQIGDFLLKRHPIVALIARLHSRARRAWVFEKQKISRIREKWKELREFITEAKGTSTFSEFYPYGMIEKV